MVGFGPGEWLAAVVVGADGISQFPDRAEEPRRLAWRVMMPQTGRACYGARNVVEQMITEKTTILLMHSRSVLDLQESMVLSASAEANS